MYCYVNTLIHETAEDCYVRFFRLHSSYYIVFFFFQAEDGIRDLTVTGVQTCALPICQGFLRDTERDNSGTNLTESCPAAERGVGQTFAPVPQIAKPEPLLMRDGRQIGRASCRERV